jgi:hypothetical protein
VEERDGSHLSSTTPEGGFQSQTLRTARISVTSGLIVVEQPVHFTLRTANLGTPSSTCCRAPMIDLLVVLRSVLLP